MSIAAHTACIIAMTISIAVLVYIITRQQRLIDDMTDELNELIVELESLTERRLTDDKKY